MDPTRTIPPSAAISKAYEISSHVALDKSCPFAREHQLENELDNVEQDLIRSDVSPIPLPGQPSINFTDKSTLFEFLEGDLCAPDLERMAPYLWTMSTQSSTNISPLHHQKVKGREIIITEDPRLHLVWIHRCVFIKPLPRYLLSQKFWKHCLPPSGSEYSPDMSSLDHSRLQTRIRKAALGYIRTYRHLIRHESDFRIAQDERLLLIPRNVSWPEFCRFTSRFLLIADSEVTLRYNYGELRLTRLNLYSKLFLRRWAFERLYGQYDAYFSRFYGPLLFTFGMLSVLLSSMQVEMAVEQVIAVDVDKWINFGYFCRWFSILVVALVFVLGFIITLILVAMIIDEWAFALKERHRKRCGSYTTNTSTGNMVPTTMA